MTQDASTAPDDGREPDQPGFDRHMLEALVCPVTHGTLHYDAARQELISRTAGLAFPIRQGIPIMLIDQARQIKSDAPQAQG